MIAAAGRGAGGRPPSAVAVPHPGRAGTGGTIEQLTSQLPGAWCLHMPDCCNAAAFPVVLQSRC